MKTVMITGVGRGIGYQLAKEYLTRGYKVIGTVRNEAAKARLNSLARDLDATASLHWLEITDSRSIERMVCALKGECIDILINCAGVLGGNHQAYDDLDFAAWQQTLLINTIAPMKVTLALLPNLSLSKNAKVVAISSAMGSMAKQSADSIAYRSSKAALNKAMQCLACELKPKNIAVYLMHPGWVRTDMGGPTGDISVEESSAGLFKVITESTMEHTGRFWQYDGQELQW